jgi:hypothetical protein
MKATTTLCIGAIIALWPTLASAATVELRNLYAVVDVIPENRADIAVEVHAPDHRLPTPSVTRNGADLVIDGSLHALHGGCGTIGSPQHGFDLSGYGWMSRRSAVSITLHTPRDVRLRANGSILGSVRPAQGVDLITNGCSRWRIADVSGTLAIRQDGAATINAGSAGATVLQLSGLSRIDLAGARALKVEMSGAGSVRLSSISGPVDASLSGLGSVHIAGGRAGRVQAEVSGMGGFSLHGSAAELDAQVSGIGSVHVDHVDGAVHKMVSGIGHVSVGA